MEENISNINSIGKGAPIDDTLGCSNSIFSMFYELRRHGVAANQLFNLLFNSKVDPDDIFELAETYYSEKNNNLYGYNGNCKHTLKKRRSTC